MKFPAPLAKSLLMAASIGLVVPMLAQTPRPGASAVPEKEAEEELKVVGVARPWSGGIMGLAVEGNAFVLRFYDAAKKPVPPPYPRAWARFNPVQKAGQQRLVMNPGSEPNSLRSIPAVRPPLVFTVTITLMAGEDDVAATATFDLREAKE